LDDVATFSAVTRQHVLQAIAEYDDRGADAFLGVYGFQRNPAATILHEGDVYDSQAILGVAHRFATGRLATADDFTGGKVPTAALLRKRGFEVTDPTAPAAPARATATRAPRAPKAPKAPKEPRVLSTAAQRRKAEEERPVVLCPTCFMVLPATGVCDTCG
jgi:hypothetical protein